MSQATEYVVTSSSRSPKAWPFYIVCDVSSSMWRADNDAQITPFSTIQDSLPQMIVELQSDEQARDIAWLSVVTFSDEPQEVLPLSRLRDVDAIARLPKGSFTDFAKIFNYMAERLRTDIIRLGDRHQLFTPIIFFITDGHPQVERSRRQPDEEWHPALRNLKQGFDSIQPSIISLGFNEAGSRNIQLIATTNPRGAACIADSGVASNDLLRAILDNIVFSVTSSTGQGQLVFETPEGMTSL